VVVSVFLTSTTVVLNISLKGAKVRPTILLESCTENFYHKSIDTFCFLAPTKSVTQNIRGVTERRLRAAQRMFGSCMRLVEQCLRNIVQQLTPRLPTTMSQP